MSVLVIAPHPDDEVIGVGGTIAKKVKAGQDVYVCVVTKGMEPIFKKKYVDQVREECREADAKLGVKETIFLDYPAVMLETVPRYELNQKIFDTIQKIMPDEVYIPHRGDMQLDHQLVVDAAMVALRPKYNYKVKKIYAYETLSETDWNIPNTMNGFIPNMYSDISNLLHIKLEAMKIYRSQISEFPAARSIEAIRALAMFRGAIMNIEAAESFIVIKELT